ncbi:hypothetical protein [Streptococcus sp. S784/96/1]|nr:hypothetical protein [Streptococcus sp. S784/96/1]
MLYEAIGWILYRSFQLMFTIIDIYLNLLNKYPVATIIITVTIYKKLF